MLSIGLGSSSEHLRSCEDGMVEVRGAVYPPDENKALAVVPDLNPLV